MNAFYSHVLSYNVASTAAVSHDPVPIEAFGKYVKQHHGEDNELFTDEYKVILLHFLSVFVN